MSMRRVQNWDIRLLKWASALNGQPFEWGRTDCGSLVREAHRVMYACDRFEHVPHFNSLREARKVFKKLGGVRPVLRAAGAEFIDVAFRQQGDVVVEAAADANGFPAASVYVDQHLLCSDPHLGVRLFPFAVAIGPDIVVLRLPHG